MTDPRATPWETHRARVGVWVSIRREERRTGTRWRVVAHESPTPAEGRARGDLSVLYDSSDEQGARAKLREFTG